jgi:hypothetical protein
MTYKINQPDRQTLLASQVLFLWTSTKDALLLLLLLLCMFDCWFLTKFHMLPGLFKWNNRMVCE